LIRVDHDALDPDPVADSHEYGRQLHGGTVRVGDDPFMPLPVVRVHLADDERNRRLHSPGVGVVDHSRAARRRLGGKPVRNLGAGGEEGDVHSVEGLWSRLPHRQSPTIGADGRAGRAPGREQTQLADRKAAFDQTWTIVRPTTPVAPTTATVSGRGSRDMALRRLVELTGTGRVYQRPAGTLRLRAYAVAYATCLYIGDERSTTPAGPVSELLGFVTSEMTLHGGLARQVDTALAIDLDDHDHDLVADRDHVLDRGNVVVGQLADSDQASLPGRISTKQPKPMIRVTCPGTGRRPRPRG